MNDGLGFLDRLVGQYNADSMRNVYDRTADAANKGYDFASRGLGELDQARLNMIAENNAKQKAGTMWYDDLGRGLDNVVDTVKSLPDEAMKKAAQLEAYRQQNLAKQNREDIFAKLSGLFS